MAIKRLGYAALAGSWLLIMCYGMQEEKLIGWRGETYNVEALWDPLKHEPKDDIPLPGAGGEPVGARCLLNMLWRTFTKLSPWGDRGGHGVYSELPNCSTLRVLPRKNLIGIDRTVPESAYCVIVGVSGG